MLTPVRRIGRVVATAGAAASLAVGVAAVPAFARSAVPDARAALTCTDTWKAAVSGSWNTASAWSKGVVPTSTDVACITNAGTYTVTADTGQTVKGLVVGTAVITNPGTQTLLIVDDFNGTMTMSSATTQINAPGVITLNSLNSDSYANLAGTTLTNAGTLQTTLGQGGPEYIESGVSTSSTGVFLIGGNTLYDQNFTMNNAGTMTVQSGGSLQVSNGAVFVQAGGSFTNQGSVQVNGATYKETGGTVSDGNITMQGATFNDGLGTGSITLICSNTLSGTVPAGQTITVLAQSCGNATVTLMNAITNNGTFIMQSQNADGSTNIFNPANAAFTNNGTLQTMLGPSGSLNYIETNVNNTSAGTISIGGTTLYDQSRTFVNTGSLTISAGQSLTFTGSSVFRQSGGTFTNSGSLTVNGASISLTAGTVAAGKATLQGATFTDAVGTGSLLLQCSNTMTGTIPAGQTVTVQANSCGSANLTIAGTGKLTNKGKLFLQSYSATASTSITDTVANGILTNAGTFQTSPGTSGASNYLEVAFTNGATGKVNVNANLLYDQAFTFTNNGALTVASGASLAFSGGSTMAQNAGKLTNSGTMTFNGATLSTAGGTVAAGSVTMQSSTFNDTVGTGSFDLQCSNTLGGTVPAGQTVTVDSNVCGSTSTTLTGNVTNNGTIRLRTSNSDNPAYILDSSGTGVLTNNGTIEAMAGAPVANVFQVNVTNAATGSISIDDHAQLSWTGFTLTESAGSTLGATVDVAANTGYGIVGGHIVLAGTLNVTTVNGTPTSGSKYQVVSTSTVSGTFAAVTGTPSYTASYTSSTVTVTAV